MGREQVEEVVTPYVFTVGDIAAAQENYIKVKALEGQFVFKLSPLYIKGKSMLKW